MNQHELHQDINTFAESHLPLTSLNNELEITVVPDVHCFTDKIVNIVYIDLPDNQFVLVDAGMPHSKEHIKEKLEERYGKGTKPACILLTHGHFDHVGSLAELLEEWQVPVYAHLEEMPYLTGKRNYPEANTDAHGGIVPKIAPMFPNHGVDLSGYVQPLPDDYSVPNLLGWNWVHTPGHTPGHVSFFRESDGLLIAGDAFVTVRQESLWKVLVQKQEISGPPKYFTFDWVHAKSSIEKLAALNPQVAVTGHGLPMTGEELTHSLQKLINHFDTIGLA
ncbi:MULTISPECIES: MBL fold metallo-hydrolase [Bacillus]|uniref:MBL fold metallo-hydrolase n=1 Tax=Bacillus TaxID=1386 RepID=UPI000BB67732|nr:MULTISPECIES: MBL fold metallo-hydrolase [Bacillus]